MAMGERIALARRITGMSLRALAERVGVSPTAVHKYEKNQDVPGSGVLIRLAEALGVGVEFFLRPARIQAMEPSFRKRQSLSEAAEAAVMGRVQEWLERYLEAEALLADESPRFAAHFEWPEGFPRAIHSVPDAEAAAQALRAAWELGQDPIDNLTELLEEKGVKVGLVAADPGFDACTFWAEAEGKVPVIALRADLPGDRQRFSLGHELAHLLLRFPEVWSEAQGEWAAHRFAGAFLVPAAAARLELGIRRHTVSLYELHMLKHKYGVSMQVWLYRAKELGILPEAAALPLLQPFQDEAVWMITEPGDPFPPEAPTRLERLVMHALSEELIAERRASELLGKSFSQFSREVARDHGGLSLVACR